MSMPPVTGSSAGGADPLDPAGPNGWTSTALWRSQVGCRPRPCCKALLHVRALAFAASNRASAHACLRAGMPSRSPCHHRVPQQDEHTVWSCPPRVPVEASRSACCLAHLACGNPSRPCQVLVWSNRLSNQDAMQAAGADRALCACRTPWQPSHQPPGALDTRPPGRSTKACIARARSCHRSPMLHARWNLAAAST